MNYSTEKIIDIYKSKLRNLLKLADKDNLSNCKFPFITNNGVWEWEDKWSNGFFPGQLWIIYKLTNENFWKIEAEKYTKVLEEYKNNGEFQDIGYILFYSFVKGYKLTNERYFLEVAIKGAENLIDSFTSGEFLKCNWLEDGEKINGIDGMMNLQLWVWAYQETNDSKYIDLINKCYKTTRKSLFKKDGSCSEYAVLDTEGNLVKMFSKNSFNEETVWTRGHVWGIYGLVILYQLIESKEMLEQLDKLIDFYWDNLNEDLIPSWDLTTNHNVSLKDTSASAAFASALFTLSKILKNTDVKKSEYYYKKAYETFQVLTSKRYIANEENHQGVLLHASTPLRILSKPGESQVWGDYFLLEALEKFINYNK